MKEIEKIEPRLGKGELWADEHIQTLLSSLESTEKEREHLGKELIEARMEIVGLRDEISELKGQIRIEIENNQGWVADLEKEKERADREEISVNELSLALQDTERHLDELVKEKEKVIELVERHQSLIKIHNDYVRKNCEDLEKEKKRVDDFQHKYLDLGEINQHLRMEILELKERVKA